MVCLLVISDILEGPSRLMDQQTMSLDGKRFSTGAEENVDTFLKFQVPQKCATNEQGLVNVP